MRAYGRTFAAFDASSGGVQPDRLPLADVEIRILRSEARLHLPETTRIFVPPPDRGGDPSQPDRLRLKVMDELFCDEMVLVYGRPLCWTGSADAQGNSPCFVERIFGEVFTLHSENLELVTPKPSVEFPRGHDRVAWSYGAVLVRGDDPPWGGSGIVHIDRRVT